MHPLTGANWHVRNCCWEASVWLAHVANEPKRGRKRGKQFFIGCFQTQVEAAHAHDIFRLRVGMPPNNFCAQAYNQDAVEQLPAEYGALASALRAADVYCFVLKENVPLDEEGSGEVAQKKRRPPKPSASSPSSKKQPKHVKHVKADPFETDLDD